LLSSLRRSLVSCCPKLPCMRGISTEILLLSSIEVEG
jgi:hypothetical protein